MKLNLISEEIGASFEMYIKQKKHFPGGFCKKGVLRNFAKFIEKHLCQSLFFNKAAGLRPAILLKKRLWHSCFPVNFGKFLRTLFSQNTPGRLLLKLLEILHEEARGLSRLDKNKALSEKQSLQIFV